MKLDAISLWYNNGNRKCAGVLLKREVAVSGEKNIESVFNGQGEELAVFDAVQPIFCAETA